MTTTAIPRVADHDGAFFARRPGATGIVAGIAAALIWATYMVFAKSGTASGLQPKDFVLLRFGTAAVIMLPWLWHNQPRTLAGVGRRRAIILTLLAGPPFILLATAGYGFAPLAHGAVIQPSTITLASMFAAAVLLGERLTRDRLAGVGLILAGLAVIAGHAGTAGSGHAWIGDLLFFSAGLCWTAFTILIRRWQLGAFAVTAAVSVVSALAVVPAMLIAGDLDRIAALPAPVLAAQIIVQGLLSGVLAVIAFGVAVRHLGAARAGLFPAIVPAATLMMGVVLTETMADTTEWIGAGLATLGLVTAIGLFRPIFAALSTLTTTSRPAKG